MHSLVKHINSSFKIFLLSTIIVLIGFNSNAEMTVEEIIKSRQALFSKNYRTAKKVQSLASNLDFEDAKGLMKEMQSLCLNVEVLSADGQAVSLKDSDDELYRAAEELGINISTRFESSSVDEI